MKFFYKIFLSMLLVLTVSLATIEYLTVSYSLEHALQREENTALSQHQMAKYSIQTVLLGITDDYTTSNMENIAKSAETPLGAQSGLFFASQNSQSGRDETVYYNSCKINPSDRIPATGILEYEIRETEKDRYLQVRSSFTLDTNSFVLVTEKNVEELFQDADTLRRRCEFFYWCILATGSFLVLVITFTLTKPLHRLQGTTRRFAKGEYDVRAEISSRDEIGDLSKTFNYMAKTIESKMEELKDAVRRQEEFTANFAHELKTPMTSIIGYADTLYQKTLSPEEVHQLAGIIMNEGMRLEALSFKLMELVTLSQSNFQLEEARIDEVIADAVETIQPTAEKRNFGLPLFMFAMMWFCFLFTHVDPKRQNISPKLIRALVWFMAALSPIVVCSSYAIALGINVNITLLTYLIIGLMLLVIGNYLAKTKQNYCAGIRLPWTLSSEENWNRTHRVSSRLFIFCGLAMIANGFLDSKILLFFIMAVLIVIPYAYSFFLFKKGI